MGEESCDIAMFDFWDGEITDVVNECIYDLSGNIEQKSYEIAGDIRGLILSTIGYEDLELDLTPIPDKVQYPDIIVANVKDTNQVVHHILKNRSYETYTIGVVDNGRQPRETDFIYDSVVYKNQVSNVLAKIEKILNASNDLKAYKCVTAKRNAINNTKIAELKQVIKSREEELDTIGHEVKSKTIKNHKVNFLRKEIAGIRAKGKYNISPKQRQLITFYETEIEKLQSFGDELIFKQRESEVDFIHKQEQILISRKQAFNDILDFDI